MLRLGGVFGRVDVKLLAPTNLIMLAMPGKLAY
jgi:hypothetical protein